MTSPPQDSDKVALSRALGAAFLNHQVEQLEKSVRAGNGRRGRGGSRGGRGPAHALAGSGEMHLDGNLGANTVSHKPNAIFIHKKDHADKIVVDASVLVYSLGQVKRWCKEDRIKEVIIPLEVLNTLDLLKKGTSGLAIRARAASRVLEAQVGANPRIRVQRDDAFVPWDEIILSPTTSSPSHPVIPPPEWLRRTICCARWESDQGGKVAMAVINSTGSMALGDEENSKWGGRADGELVRIWASRAGIDVLNVEESVSDGTGHGNGVGRGRRGFHTPTRARKRELSDPSASMVERVPVGPIKVLRVLARGETLDP